MEQEEQHHIQKKPEVLQKTGGVRITRLDERRVQLRTTPGRREYSMMVFVLLLCSFMIVVGIVGVVSTLEPGGGSLQLLGWAGLALWVLFFLIGIWLALYHTLPKTFTTDTQSRKCIHTFRPFFRREIPFEDVEYIEEYSNRNGIGFYLKEKGKLWRTCIFFANGFTKSMGAPEAAVRIFTREFEKAGITFAKSKEDAE
jgi:hypothetical protein